MFKAEKLNLVDSYSSFAVIYDQVMDHVNYRKWAEFILDKYSKYRTVQPMHVLDIACGSGKLLQKMKSLVKANYYGMDKSAQMLEIAGINNPNITLKIGDMTKLNFNDNFFCLATNTHDSINYLMNEADLENHFLEAARIIKPGGIYFLDMTTEENILDHFHNKIDKFKKSGIHLKWRNKYNKNTKIIESRLEFTNKSGYKTLEVHYQKFYPVAQLNKIAKKSGLRFLQQYSDYGVNRKNKKALVNLFYQKD